LRISAFSEFLISAVLFTWSVTPTIGPIHMDLLVMSITLGPVGLDVSLLAVVGVVIAYLIARSLF